MTTFNCRDCNSQWRGEAVHCMRCHRSFGSESAYSAHERDTEPCLDPISALYGETSANAGHHMYKLAARRLPFEVWVINRPDAADGFAQLIKDNRP